MKNALNPAQNIFILLVSLGILSYSIWQLYQLINLKYNSNSTQGTITGYYKREGNAKFIWNRKPEYAPTFSFINKDNKEVSVISTTYKKGMKYKKGDQINVYYDKQQPNKARIDDSFPWTRHMMMSLAGLMGLFYTLSKYFGYKI